MKGCRGKYKLNTEIHLTKLRSETRYKKKIKKKNNHTALGFLNFPYYRFGHV